MNHLKNEKKNSEKKYFSPLPPGSGSETLYICKIKELIPTGSDEKKILISLLVGWSGESIGLNVADGKIYKEY